MIDVYLRYISGACLEPYGFKPNRTLVGKSFKEAAIYMAETGDAILLAAQIDGSLVINPGRFVLEDDTILFAMCSDLDDLHTFALDGDAEVSSWLPTFNHNRHSGSAKERLKVAQQARGYSENFTHDGSSVDKKSPEKAEDDNLPPAPKEGENKNRLTLPGMGLRKQKKMHLQSVNHVTRHSMVQHIAHKDLNEDNVVQLGMPPEGLIRKGGHVVIALISHASDADALQGLWQQVEVIIKDLRDMADTPLVVISALGLSQENEIKKTIERIRESYSPEGEHTIFVVEGDILRPHILKMAGVMTASHFMTLGPSAPRSSGIMDRQNILAQLLIDKQLREWGREDLAVCFDWYSLDSFRLMRAAPKPGVPSGAPLPNLTKGDETLAVKEPLTILCVTICVTNTCLYLYMCAYAMRNLYLLTKTLIITCVGFTPSLTQLGSKSTRAHVRDLRCWRFLRCLRPGGNS